jgi:hypothetical protein
MSAGRIILLVFSILIVLAAIGLIIGGGVILAFDTGFKDVDGYYSTGSIPVESSSSAIITYPSDFENEPDMRWENQSYLSIRVEASNTDSSQPIFIGIAHENDLNKYLDGVSYDKFEGFSSHPYKVHLTQISGTHPPSPPATQSFWVASAQGTGTQTLNWDVISGSYSLVLMNTDGSPPIDARVALGAKMPPVLHAVGIGLLVGGIVLLIVSGILIYFALHGRKKRSDLQLLNNTP